MSSLESFVYLPVSPEERHVVSRDGLVLTPQIRARLVHRLEQAHAAREADVVVMSRSVVSKSASDDARPIPADQFLNLHPYAPPARVLAAGGYLIRPASPEPEVLLIRRRGVWDLPKGKLDPHEQLEECAVREVQEELGIDQVAVLSDLGTTEHGYRQDGYYWVKRTHWYLMRTDAHHFVPQESEGITDVAWMALSRAPQTLGFATLRAHAASIPRDVVQALITEPAGP